MMSRSPSWRGIYGTEGVSKLWGAEEWTPGKLEYALEDILADFAVGVVGVGEDFFEGGAFVFGFEFEADECAADELAAEAVIEVTQIGGASKHGEEVVERAGALGELERDEVRA